MKSSLKVILPEQMLPRALPGKPLSLKVQNQFKNFTKNDFFRPYSLKEIIH